MSSARPIPIWAAAPSWRPVRYERFGAAKRRRSPARLVEEARQHDAGVEALARDLGRGARVAGIVAVDAIDPGKRLVRIRERQQPFAAGQMCRPAGVLHEGRPPRREIALRAIAEPTR